MRQKRRRAQHGGTFSSKSIRDAPRGTQSAGKGIEDLHGILADLNLTPDTRAAIETVLAVTMASEQAQLSNELDWC